MTINKAQGQTLDQVGIYLRELVFSHCQLYVALSRARRSENLKIVTKSLNNEEESKFTTKNIISFDILQRAGILKCNFGIVPINFSYEIKILLYVYTV